MMGQRSKKEGNNESESGSGTPRLLAPTPAQTPQPSSTTSSDPTWDIERPPNVMNEKCGMPPGPPWAIEEKSAVARNWIFRTRR